MKTAGSRRIQANPRLNDNRELFGGQQDGLHPGSELGGGAEQSHTQKAISPQEGETRDKANSETMDPLQEQPIHRRPVSHPEQMSDAPKPEIGRYPLLEALLGAKGLRMKGVWTLADVAGIFDASKRTIQDWIKDEKLVDRHLPARGRFLSQDLENFLRLSLRKKGGANREEGL